MYQARARGLTRTVIGISAMAETAQWSHWRDVDVNVSQRTYSGEVAAAGGVPILLPAHDAALESVPAILDLLSGLILAGGADLDPSTYGEAPSPRTTPVRAERDRFEIALAREALARDLPLLGICRGMEVMNVACGGTLVQDLPDVETHLHTPGQFSDHGVDLEPGSLAARAVGAERVTVRSHHHQGVDRLADGLRATAWADPGRVIEAIERDDRAFALGILWHAEEEPGGRLMTSFVEAAAASTPAREAA
jgi:putative glutamine amidotransferase